VKLEQLQKALEKIDLPEFGICIRCANAIPQRRIMLMPESAVCVTCAEK
jgi:DnaK suppressor protein